MQTFIMQAAIQTAMAAVRTIRGAELTNKVHTRRNNPEDLI